MNSTPEPLVCRPPHHHHHHHHCHPHHHHCGWPDVGPWHCDPCRPPKSEWEKTWEGEPPQRLTLSNDRYDIQFNRADQSCTVYDKSTGKTEVCKVSGDPHLDFEGKRVGDIKGDFSIKLDSGLQLHFDTKMPNGEEPPQGYTGVTYADTVTVVDPRSGAIQVDGLFTGDRLKKNFELPGGPFCGPFLPDAADLGAGGEPYMSIYGNKNGLYTRNGRELNQTVIDAHDAINKPDGHIWEQLRRLGMCCHTDPGENERLLRQLEALIRTLSQMCPSYANRNFPVIMQTQQEELMQVLFGLGAGEAEGSDSNATGSMFATADMV